MQDIGLIFAQVTSSYLELFLTHRAHSNNSRNRPDRRPENRSKKKKNEKNFEIQFFL